MRPRIIGLAILLLSAMGATGAQTASPTGEAFQISGTAVNAVGGQPVARAKISVVSANLSESAPTFFAPGSTSEMSVVQTVYTGEDGRFLFKGVEAGRYALVAECRGFYRQNLDAH